jgi:nucleoside-diphosphate-sugar epimerase
MSDYFKSELRENETIKTALKKVSGFFGKVGCVVNKKGALIGVLTAGDLRRAMLNKGCAPNHPIKNIYNKRITFIYSDELKNKKFIKSNFASNEINDSIFYIPIINKEKKVVDVLPTERVLEILDNRKINKKSIKQKLPRVLVVGGAGYIGSVLCLKLLKKNYEILVVDKLLYDKNVIKTLKKFKKFKFMKADICDLNVQINSIKNIDAVIFLAEIVGDPACNARPEDAIKTNFLSISSMAQLCSYLNISKFIYTSSCSVYGLDKNNDLLTEKSNLNPLSHYARMKIMSEKALFKNKNEFFRPTILRLGTVFGPSLRNRFDLVVNTLAKNAFYKNKIQVHGGNQWRPNIHVEDVADGIITTLSSDQRNVGNKIFNLTSTISNYKIIDLANHAMKVFKKTEIEIIKSLIDNRNYRVSAKSFYKAVGFKAKKTVSFAFKQFKKIFENEKKFDPEKKMYYNVKTISEK